MYDTMFNTGSLNKNENFDNIGMEGAPYSLPNGMYTNYPGMNIDTDLPESYMMGNLQQSNSNKISNTKGLRSKRKYESTLITLLIVVIVVIIVMYKN